MTKRFFLPLLVTLIGFGCTDDDNENTTAEVSFNFSHTWNSTTIDNSNLTTINVTNENGETMDFTRIRYLISRFELESVDSDISYAFDGYKFTDLSDEATYNFRPPNPNLPSGRYRLHFIWGFNEEDNITAAYPDLNSASWSWPPNLGGGYHFLQMDGQYNIDSTPSSFNFHNGTARQSIDPPVFEQNFKEIVFDEIIEISGSSSVEIVMDFSEFFKNPHVWDLNVLNTPLMPNYMAQKMMQDNVGSVFSIGSIDTN